MAQTTVRLLIECPKDDLLFFERLKAESHDITIISTSNFQGSLEVIEVIISITAVIVPVITAFLTGKPRSGGKRKVVIDGEKKVFENYEAEEVTKILKGLNE